MMVLSACSQDSGGVSELAISSSERPLPKKSSSARWRRSPSSLPAFPKPLSNPSPLLVGDSGCVGSRSRSGTFDESSAVVLNRESEEKLRLVKRGPRSEGATGAGMRSTESGPTGSGCSSREPSRIGMGLCVTTTFAGSTEISGATPQARASARWGSVMSADRAEPF